MAAKTQDAAGETGEADWQVYTRHGVGVFVGLMPEPDARMWAEQLDRERPSDGPHGASRVPRPIAAPTGETDSQILDRLLVRCAFYFNGVRVRTHEELTAALDNYALAAPTPEAHVLAARVPAPSAPQEPCGEPSEGMRDEALAALERAHAVVSELCDGTRKWIMSIPARPDHDPDLIIGKGIRLARRALSTGGRDAD